jgi:zinc transport system substrate-binding protein
MASLSGARLYFAIGVPFESAWLEKIQTANPRLTIVHTEDGIRKIPMAASHDDGGEQHGEGQSHENSGHDHGRLDPHVWLSPPLVKVQAGHILKALIAEDPDNEENYRSNYDAFVSDLDRLHDHLTAIFADRKNEAFLVYHPSWGYFADTYGIRQVPIELEGKSPKPAHLEALITWARREGIRVVFVQPQFSEKSAAAVAKAIGGEVVFADPLAADWADNLRRQAERFQAALKPSP